jgi:CubicO group peptidase (beta-lactamase class C family)
LKDAGKSSILSSVTISLSIPVDVVMNQIRSIPLLALLLLTLTAATSCGGLSTSRAERLGFDGKLLPAIGRVVLDQVDAKRIAGGVVLVACKGEVVYHEAFGLQDVERQAPMQPDTMFRIASMTKPITSVAAMILVEEGKLKLDDPVSKFIPEFANPRVLIKSTPKEGQKPQFGFVPASSEITVRHLLTHTSGLSYRFFEREYLADRYTKDGVSDGLVETDGSALDNARRIAKAPLLFSPGEGWEYSLSTDVLGAVIEQASGTTLADFLRTRICEPLGMNDTHFHVSADKAGRVAVVYASSETESISPLPFDKPVVRGNLVYSQTYPLRKPARFFSGGAGLVSTANDYFRFAQMLLEGGELDGVRVLRKETVLAMRTNQCGELDPALSRQGKHGGQFGFGFGIVTEEERADGLGTAGSFGWGGFFNTYFWIDPHRKLVGILMTQLYPNGHVKMRDKFRGKVYDALSYALLTD